MCARATLINPGIALEVFGATTDEPLLVPRFNIAPTQPIAAIRLRPDGSRRLDLLRWGLVPAWASSPKGAAKLINARSETLFETRAFRAAAEARRCVVVVDGFYEWQRQAAGSQPYLLRRADGQPFGLAAVWERWSPVEAPGLESCSIVTTGALPPVTAIHDRMPVLLDRGEVELWLSPELRGDAARERLRPLLKKRPPPELVAVAVSTRVNKPANDDTACLAPAEGPPAGQQRLPFG